MVLAGQHYNLMEAPGIIPGPAASFECYDDVGKMGYTLSGNLVRMIYEGVYHDWKR